MVRPEGLGKHDCYQDKKLNEAKIETQHKFTDFFYIVNNLIDWMLEQVQHDGVLYRHIERLIPVPEASIRISEIRGRDKLSQAYLTKLSS
jgi:hypothetical protein